MKQRSIAIVLALLLVTLSMPFSSASAVQNQAIENEIEEALFSTSVGIDYYGAGLLMGASFVFGAAPELTYFNVALQQYNNGSWSTWTSYSGTRCDWAWGVEYPVTPPRGYWYRTKLTASSLNFPGIEMYSRELYY